MNSSRPTCNSWCWRRWKGCGAVDCKSVKLFGRKREGGGCGRWGAIVSSLNGNALNRRRTPQWVGGTLQAPSVIQPESWIKGRRSESWRAGFKLSTSSPLFLITIGNGFSISLKMSGGITGQSAGQPTTSPLLRRSNLAGLCRLTGDQSNIGFLQRWPD